jgi:hypothetical protein
VVRGYEVDNRFFEWELVEIMDIKSEAVRNQTQKNIVMAQTLDSPEFHAARDRWLAEMACYEEAMKECEVRHTEWMEASTKLKAVADLSVTAAAIYQTRKAFKKHLTEHADVNGTFQEAYFTTDRDDQFKSYRADILDAVRAHDAAIKAHQFEANTIPEYDRWRIADRRVHSYWELTEAAMANIQLIANVAAMNKFAEAEGLKDRAAEFIADAYYARYPAGGPREPIAATSYTGHGRVGGITPTNIQREGEIAAQITGDEDLAKDIVVLDKELRERRNAISPERQVEITKAYSVELGDVIAPAEKLELDDPPKTR